MIALCVMMGAVVVGLVLGGVGGAVASLTIVYTLLQCSPPNM